MIAVRGEPIGLSEALTLLHFPPCEYTFAHQLLVFVEYRNGDSLLTQFALGAIGDVECVVGENEVCLISFSKAVPCR
jgi:hypothetical protein